MFLILTCEKKAFFDSLTTTSGHRGRNILDSIVFNIQTFYNLLLKIELLVILFVIKLIARINLFKHIVTCFDVFFEKIDFFIEQCL